jgi:dihydrofolate reductase
MRKVFLYMTTTLDGFISGPDGELDWMLSTPDQGLNDDIIALIQESDGGILGYPVAQGMIPYWESVANTPSASPAARDLAAAVNRQHRIIVSSHPVDMPWDNSELILARDDNELIAGVTELKQQPGNGLAVAGGVRTAQRLTRLGLIDEYILHVHPIAIGTGKPLFTQRTQLFMVSAKTYDSGVTRLCYKRG